MNIALDIGTSEIRSLRLGDGRLLARRCPSVYCILEDNDSNRSILQQIGTSFAVCEGQLVVFGDEAERLTPVFRIPRLELFPEGELPKDDPPARQLLGAIVESMVGRPAQADAICCLTLPGEEKSGGDWSDPSSQFLRRLVELLGYKPGVVSAPHALVLAEMADCGFSGIGLVFGAATSEAALVHRGRELHRCAVPYAGNWIDVRLARSQKRFVWDADGNKFLDTAAMRTWKESIDSPQAAPESYDRQLLTDLNRGMIEFLLQHAEEKFAEALVRNKLVNSLPIVIAGGSSRLPQFREFFLDIARTVSFPGKLSDIRLPADADLAIARGALIRAELESAESTQIAA